VPVWDTFSGAGLALTALAAGLLLGLRWPLAAVLALMAALSAGWHVLA